MFIKGFIISIILGYILGGRLKNLENVNISALYLMLTSFIIEAALHFLVVKNILEIGIITYVFNFLMYILIFVFVFLNRKNIFILTMGFGFLLNAIVIFLNGGVMPVSETAIAAVSLPHNIASEGLYGLMSSGTKLWFLTDIFIFKPLGHIVFSIGDIIADIGFMVLIITSMRKKTPQSIQ